MQLNHECVRDILVFIEKYHSEGNELTIEVFSLII